MPLSRSGRNIPLAFIPPLSSLQLKCRAPRCKGEEEALKSTVRILEPKEFLKNIEKKYFIMYTIEFRFYKKD
jgi:hypothetical protein